MRRRRLDIESLAGRQRRGGRIADHHGAALGAGHVSLGLELAEGVERVEELLCRGEAVGGVLAEQAVDDLAEARVHPRRDAGEGRGRVVDLLAKHLDEVLALEGRTAGEEVEEGGAKRIEVGARAGGPAVGHLGRHIGGGAERLTLDGGAAGDQVGAGAGPVVGALGQAEVGHPHLALGVEHEIRRLDVPMYDAGVMGCPQGAAHLLQDLEGPLGLEGPLAAQDGVEALAVDVLHGEVVGAIGKARIVGLDDVGVAEPGGGSGLADEPVDEFLVLGEPLGEDLERDQAIHGDLPGLEHGTHAAAAQGAHDLEPRDPLRHDGLLAIAGRARRFAADRGHHAVLDGRRAAQLLYSMVKFLGLEGGIPLPPTISTVGKVLLDGPSLLIGQLGEGPLRKHAFYLVAVHSPILPGRRRLRSVFL